MLAIGRGLMAEPRLLILDEPSLGLSPLLVEEMFALVRTLKPRRSADHAGGAERGAVARSRDPRLHLENGTVALDGEAATLAADPALRRAYLGL